MEFGKLLTAMITPFKENGEVDFEEAVKIANHLADTGTETILLSGTTGESPTLTHKEEQQLFKEVKMGIGTKAKIMAGTGSNCTRTAIESTQLAEKLGVDSILQVVPYYNKPSQEGIYRHFQAVAMSTGLPIMLYNIPGRTSRNMEPETLLRLTSISNIKAVKEASGDLKQMRKIIEICPKEFLVYSGDDGLTLDLLKLGGVGVVSVASHLVGLKIKRMVNAVEEEKMDEAEEINKDLADIFKVLFITTNPVPVKEAMNMLGFKCGKPRLPLVELTEAERAIVKKSLQKLALIK